MKIKHIKKRTFAIITIVIIFLLLCSCSNYQKPSDNTTEPTGAGMENSESDCTLDDISNELGLRKIEFENATVDRCSKINLSDGYAIYSIDITEDETQYNIRVAEDNGSGDSDISGVHFSDKAECVIYDSADEEAMPSLYVEGSREGTKAFCTWKGYFFSVSTGSRISPEDFQRQAAKLAGIVVSKANLDFEINYYRNDDLKTVTLYKAEDYSVKSYGGEVSITVENDMVYSLKDALNNNIITADDIVAKCKADEKRGAIKSSVYKDGGSTEYYYDSCTVLKLNTLDGDKDLIIAGQGVLIDDYDKLIKND